METWIPALGAFGFGVVIGWFVYYVNRYRKGDVQLGDVGTLAGIIGGGAITSLFGNASGLLFGAYGLGLAIGFFAYFLVLLGLVRASNGIFTVTWFLDGRKKALADGEIVDAQQRPTVTPMFDAAVQSFDSGRPARAPSSLLPAISMERDNAIAALNLSMRKLEELAGQTADNDERNRLYDARARLSDRHDELLLVRLREILESDAAQRALARLQIITADLTAEAAKMKNAANAIATAAAVVDKASKVVTFLTAILA